MLMKKMQDTYQGEIILRIFDGDKKKMAEFHEDYKEACHSIGRNGVPIGDKEMKMLEMYKSGKTTKQIADVSNLSESQVRTRLFYAAVRK